MKTDIKFQKKRIILTTPPTKNDVMDCPTCRKPATKVKTRHWKTKCGGEYVELVCNDCGTATPSTFIPKGALALRDELSELTKKGGGMNAHEIKTKIRKMCVNLSNNGH